MPSLFLGQFALRPVVGFGFFAVGSRLSLLVGKLVSLVEFEFASLGRLLLFDSDYSLPVSCFRFCYEYVSALAIALDRSSGSRFGPGQLESVISSCFGLLVGLALGRLAGLFVPCRSVLFCLNSFSGLCDCEFSSEFALVRSHFGVALFWSRFVSDGRWLLLWFGRWLSVLLRVDCYYPGRSALHSFHFQHLPTQRSA